MASYKQKPCPTSFATCSIGYKDSHKLPQKLEAIATAGFKGIELSMPDILAFGADLKGHEIDPKDYDSLVEIGAEIRKLVDNHGLKVMMLQPFANFEGWPEGSAEREDAFERARGWMRIMEAVGTDLLQIGSSDAENISASTTSLANDLAMLADEMKPRGFRIAYENWCWATRAPSWKTVWEIVRIADRPNIGLCLDTFQSAGGEWGDPTTKSGLVSSGESSAEEITARWKASLQELTRTVPAEKIFLLQISDAYRMDPPIADKPDQDGLRPRGQWSHDYRPLPFDGGYLPVVDFTSAVMETGFRGWLSIEVFDMKPENVQAKYGDDMIPYAGRAMDSLKRLLKEAEM